MPRFLDTSGNSTLGIGICGRCNRKFPLGALEDDPNTPGLKVCAADKDQYDPYRLPARPPDHINLPFVRPDQSIAVTPVGGITDDEEGFMVDDDGGGYLVP